MPQIVVSRERKYRSRKEQPCDNCRRRRTCCIRKDDGNCALCSTRGVNCTFISLPEARKTRRSSLSRRRTSTTSSTANLQAEEQQGQASREQPLEYVGLSGTKDLYFVADGGEIPSRSGSGGARSSENLERGPVIPAYFTLSTAPQTPESEVLDSNSQTSRTIDSFWPMIISAYFDTVHQSFPILDPSRAELYSRSRILKIAISVLAEPFCAHAIIVDHDNVLKHMHRSLLFEASRPTLETVESMLLFVQIPMRTQSPNLPRLWVLLGTLVGISHILGLNIDCSKWEIPEREKKRRRRLWWAVFVQDKWFAMTLGRPSYLSEDHADVPLVMLTDFRPSEQCTDNDSAKTTNTAACCFIALAELSLILANLLNSFYTINALLRSREADVAHIIDTGEGIQTKLHQWRSQHLGPLLAKRSFPDITGFVELAYLTIEIMLYRALCPKLSRRGLPLGEYSDRSKNASLAMVDLVETLQISRLRTFWWSTSGLNLALNGTFMVNMMKIEGNIADRDNWTERLEYFSKLLNAHSQGFEPARLAVSFLDSHGQDLKKGQGQNSTSQHFRTMSTGEAAPPKSNLAGVPEPSMANHDSTTHPSIFSTDSTTNRTLDNRDNQITNYLDYCGPSTPWDMMPYDFLAWNDADFENNY